jgi:ubiquinone/menaquinone biosynthesis C-methylase UbiE
MPDVYSTITELPDATVAILADAMERRAALPSSRAMLDAYLELIPFPKGARVLEVGCGSGAISEVIAARPKVGEVIGLDPSPGLIKRARELRSHLANLTFQEGDGKTLPFPDNSIDAVVMHTVLTHVPAPEAVVAEARRVLRSGGWLAAFDGDYGTVDVARGDHDPLSACIAAFKESFINDLWLGRRLPQIVRTAGFDVEHIDHHSYVETGDVDASTSYLLTIVDRGADALASAGTIGADLAGALKSEGRERIAQGTFFGRIEFISVIARR